MGEWQNLGHLGPKKFQCGFCGMIVGSDKGYSLGGSTWRICICPHCDKPTYFENSKQYPAAVFGNQVNGLPSKEIESLYNEARRCTSVQAYTAAVLACRKLLMNIAVQKGADEGKKFIEYVEYLADRGYVPPNGKGWVDHIRKKGNEATHEIALMSEDDAKDLITFIEMLLKFIYEFPSKITPK